MSTDFEKLVKDHLRMRLMESGWTAQLNEMIKNSVKARLAAGQVLSTIKFEQLYKDVAIEARDSLSSDMELELHTKMNEYLSLNLEDNDDEETNCNNGNNRNNYFDDDDSSSSSYGPEELIRLYSESC
ncbi:uncharacterized protein LOC126833634 [Adelges cooleyi]|uniref:uncharacterized protein LOC126833634 n=1 Tax=Adelges cooleyi TaxID=133065 RepID=UPI00217FDD5F|nr:uncharacterized protein LOC126833634 [Adelges cooleyi]